MKIRSILVCAAAALAASGCATIVAKSNQTMTVTSVPPGAALSITNAAGASVHSGDTPMTVTLKKGRGYFKSEHYVIHITKDGYKARDIDVRGQVNGWYFGNIIFGGLIGLLAVDPATGAMYTLTPKDVTATLDTLNVKREGDAQTLTVMLVEDVPQQFVGQLIPISTN